MKTTAFSGYWSTHDLRERFRCSSRTIYRWTEKKENPFPRPHIVQNGACNLWGIEAVLEWEQRVLTVEEPANA